MKRINKTLSALALAAGAMLVSAPASADVIISFSPSATHLNVGDSVTIDMSISGLLGTEILSAFDFNALWNSSVASWTVFSVIPGCSQLGVDAICDIDTIASNNLGAQGSAFISDDDLAAFQPDSFLIAQFTLQGVADGVTTFTLGTDLDFERNFVGRDFSTLDVDVLSACIAVGEGSCDNRVPEPASFGLAGLALLAAGAAGRIRRRSRASV